MQELGFLVSSLSCLASFVAVISLFRLKRTEIDLSLRDERIEIIKDIDQYITRLFQNDLSEHYGQKLRDGASDVYLMNEIHQFFYRSKLAFSNRDIEKIERIIIKPLNQCMRESINFYHHKNSLLEKDEKYYQKYDEFTENNDEIIKKIEKIKPYLDEIENQYCKIDVIYPSICFFRKWR